MLPIQRLAHTYCDLHAKLDHSVKKAEKCEIAGFWGR
jgi:hypothetical protein